MDKYFKYLESINIEDGPSAVRVIGSKKPTDALEILAKCFDLVNEPGSQKQANRRGLFDFAASASISGSVEPCSSIQCRLNGAYTLATFAALYGDNVTIPNFFDYFYDYAQSERYPFRNEFEVKNFYNRLIGDIAVYYEYRPLIDAGIVKVNQTMILICSNCQKQKLYTEERVMNEVEKIATVIQRDLHSKVKFRLHSDHYIDFIDQSNYLNADGVRVNKLRGVREAKTTRLLNKAELQKLGIDSHIVAQSVNDILMQNYYDTLRDKTYLTNRPMDVDIIEGANEISKSISPIVPAELIHTIPTVSEVDIQKVLDVRKGESAAFETYRDSLKAVIQEARDNGRESLSKAIEESVTPSIHKIQQIVESNRKFFQEKSVKKVVIGATVATAGLIVDGFLNTNIGLDVAKKVGSTMGTRAVTDLVSASITPQEARYDKFYFLWKVAKAHSH